MMDVQVDPATKPAVVVEQAPWSKKAALQQQLAEVCPVLPVCGLLKGLVHRCRIISPLLSAKSKRKRIGRTESIGHLGNPAKTAKCRISTQIHFPFI